MCRKIRVRNLADHDVDTGVLRISETFETANQLKEFYSVNGSLLQEAQVVSLGGKVKIVEMDTTADVSFEFE